MEAKRTAQGLRPGRGGWILWAWVLVSVSSPASGPPDDSPATLKPAALEKGDIIGLVAPASPPDEDVVQGAVRRLREHGYGVRLSRSYLEPAGYLAASDEVRAAEIEGFFRDPDVRAIICLRGGYGSPRLLDRIDYAVIRENPKILMGYSDITALLNAVNTRTGLVVFHGPMARELAEGSFAAGELWDAFRPRSERWKNWGGTAGGGRDVLVPGVAEGPLVGGNLSVLVSTLGTHYEARFAGAILFLEDVNEKAFRIDRMLNQLRLGGRLAQVRGVLLGSFSGCGTDVAEGGLRELFLHYFGGLGVPVLAGFPAGHHVREHVPLPLGVRVRLDAGARALSLLESPVREEKRR